MHILSHYRLWLAATLTCSAICWFEPRPDDIHRLLAVLLLWITAATTAILYKLEVRP